MTQDYRRLLELSARCEEKYLLTHDDRYFVMATKYLRAAIDAPKVTA